MRVTHAVRATIVSFFTVLACGVGPAALGVTRYVDQNNASPTPPYTNWSSAATIIQDAVNLCSAGDVVLVSNGMYATGGATITNFPGMTNRVVITNAISVIGVNGPLVTSIVGQFDPITGGAGSNAVRCALVSGGGFLAGFTLTNGATATLPPSVGAIQGGGLRLAGGTASNLVVRNCRSSSRGGGVLIDSGGGSVLDSVVMENFVSGAGGGITFNSGGTLRNTLVMRNAATGNGGGVAVGLSGTIESCTIAGNAAPEGCGLTVSGDSIATVVNTIIHSNTNSADQYFGPTNIVKYSCSSQVIDGVGNFVADPLFLNTANYRLRANSPCVDAGTNQAWSLAVNAKDIDGEARIRNGRIDIGADEAWQYQALSVAPSGSGVTIAWDVLTNGVFDLQGSVDMPGHAWSDTGVTVTSEVAYVTTTLVNASADYQSYRLERQ